MSNVDDPVKCPHCKQTFRRRDLGTTMRQVVALHCRSCGALIEQVEEDWAPPRVREEVDAIERWLDGVAHALGYPVTPVRTEEADGRYLWRVERVRASGEADKAPPWECWVTYVASRPGTASVELHSARGYEKVLADKPGLTKLCAKHGLGPRGHKHVDKQEPQRNAGWWGAQQIILIGQPSEMFQPIIDRLAEAMRDIAAHFGPQE